MSAASDGTLTQTADSPVVLQVSISCERSVPSARANLRSAPFVPQSDGLKLCWRAGESRTKSGKFESVVVIFPGAGEIVIE